MKLKLRIGQRIKLVFALIARWLWKHFRLLKQCPHRYNSARRHWMTFPPSILWDCWGSLTFWGIRKWNCQWARKGGNCSPVCWTGTNLLAGGVSWQNIRKLIIPWMDNQHTAMWQGVSPVLRDRLENWFRALVPLLGLGYCPFKRIQSRVVTSSSLDKTPWEDTST